MAKAVFHPPKRKRRVYQSYESPFPISSSQEDVCGRDYKICEAEIINNNVIVKNPDDIEQLYSKGFFGKGIISRSQPVYNISDPVLVAKWQDVRFNMPIVSSKKFHCHVEWAKRLMQEQGLDDRTIEATILNYTKPLNLKEATKQNSESWNEGTPEGEATEDEPKCLVTSAGTNGNKVACLEGNPFHDPLAKYDSNESNITRFKAVAKTHSTMHPFSFHDSCAQNDCMKQESHILINKEYDHEYVLVEEEELNLCPEEEETSEKQHMIKGEKLVCRRNPFRIFEYLQLSLEEAFFLVYALGCLSIHYNEAPLSILKLWKVFSEVQPNFRSTYMAYHHFRCKGWVPKVGLKYGTDLYLYVSDGSSSLGDAISQMFSSEDGAIKHVIKLGFCLPATYCENHVPIMCCIGRDHLFTMPGYDHYMVKYFGQSTVSLARIYSVIAELVNDDDFEGSPHRPFSWKTLSGLNRTTTNVSKELMFCYLIKPSNMTEKEMSSPECLKRIKVQELILNRWVSSRERSEQEDL